MTASLAANYTAYWGGSQFPITVPMLSVLIKLEAGVKEHGDYMLQVTLVDPEEKKVIGGESELSFKTDWEANGLHRVL